MKPDLSLTNNWVDLLGCPNCQHKLGVDLKHSEYLTCKRCDRYYGMENGIPLLVREEDLEILGTFTEGYQDLRFKEGWRPPTTKQALQLPFAQPGGYPRMYWELRRQSYRTFMEVLARKGPLPRIGPVAELGAGNGWLSYNLARCGYRVVAVDANINNPFGLGAAKIYLAHAVFTLVQGDLNRPPLQEDKFSLVIFNASLHYARDLKVTLEHAARVLLPEGKVVILDSPLAGKPRPGSGIGDRHLGCQELEDALAEAGFHPQWISIRRGVSWWVRQALRWVRAEPSISFPMLIAQKV